MTCRNAFSAAQTRQPNGDAPAYGHTSSQNTEAGSDTALITRVMQRLNYSQPLALTAAHQRQALILDRDKAAQRMDTQQVHRLESDLRKLTNRILDKGVCSDGATS